MEYEIFLIRHGKTRGNLEGRFIGGRTDDELAEEGIAELLQLRDSRAELIKNKKYKLFSSPMKRCRQTCEILFPGQPVETLEEFREIDFGDFENKNHAELDGNPLYQRWIDEGGTGNLPGGEPMSKFIARSLRGIDRVVAILKKSGVSCGVIVCHGGNIMAVMSQFGDFYDFHVGNGEGYRLTLTEEGGKVIALSFDSI